MSTCLFCKQSEGRHGAGGRCHLLGKEGEIKGWAITTFTVCRHAVQVPLMVRGKKRLKCMTCGDVFPLPATAKEVAS